MTVRRQPEAAGLPRIETAERPAATVVELRPARAGYLVTSMPKAGTHLLGSLIERVTGQAPVSMKEKPTADGPDFGKYARHANLVGHFRIKQVRMSDSLRQLFLQRRVVVLIRDPRDVCNSMLHYVLQSSNPQHRLLAARLTGMGFEEQIMSIARGVAGADGTLLSPSLKGWCSGFVDLTHEFKNATLLRYEELQEPYSAASAAARIFEMPPTEAGQLVEGALASTTKTKRDGGATAYQWRTAFTPALKQFFVDECADLLKHMGYGLTG